MDFILGLILGAVLMAVAIWKLAPPKMIPVHQSKLSVDETVAAIEKNALDKGWLVPKIYNIQNSLLKAGHDDMTQLRILSICHPHYSYDILKNDQDKFVSGIMPCRIAVYEAKKDGKAYIAEMDMGLMSKMFGGNIAKVMEDVSREEREMVEPLFAK
jgi:uncharacterized protein (DUF302 family)